MKLQDAREAYETLSGKASEIVRQLSLAGVALIWIFKSGTDAAPTLDVRLLRGTLFIFIALFLDLLQYLVGTATWHAYFRIKEKRRTPADEEFEAPVRINWPTWILFWLKSAAMLIAYAMFILPFLIHKFVRID